MLVLATPLQYAPASLALFTKSPLSPSKMRWALASLLTIVLLFVVFALGLLVVRIMRQRRLRLERRRPEPTEYVDAWSMHKAPADWEPPDDEDTPAP
jgi:hypothetical protein